MSYSRFGCDGSDVYIFPSDRGLECCVCPLTSTRQSFVCRTIREMEEHVEAHRAAGQFVPESVIPEIRGDKQWLLDERIIAE
jgi:hypothetical protein